MTMGKSILDQAFKLYAKWCEQTGIIFQQPSMLTEAEFLETLRFENCHGTIVQFKLDKNGKLSIYGTTCHEMLGCSDKATVHIEPLAGPGAKLRCAMERVGVFETMLEVANVPPKVTLDRDQLAAIVAFSEADPEFAIGHIKSLLVTASLFSAFSKPEKKTAKRFAPKGKKAAEKVAKKPTRKR